MINYVQGNIFNSQCDVITVTVNCVGIMGAGLAKQCKERYPITYRHYKHLCDQGEIRPGKPRLVNYERPILLFPTKNDWRNNSQIEWVEEGLKRISKNSQHFQSIAIPPLGCGLGGLDWDQVRGLIIKHLGPIKNNVFIYKP